MDIQAILAQLTQHFGDNFDISKVTSALKGLDLKNLDFKDIVSKLHADGLLSNINLDSLKDNAMDALKGNAMDALKEKAGGMLGGLFGK